MDRRNVLNLLASGALTALAQSQSFKPLSPAQKTALLAKTQEAAMTGDHEPFKTTQIFDGTAQNPAWLG
jgi:hypothetical protein